MMPEYNNLFDQLNEEARLDLLAEAERSRRQFLLLSGIVLKELLESQAFSTDNTEQGEELNLWVTREVGAAPTAFAGVGRTCLTFMLEGRSYLTRRNERMRVLVPVADDFNQDDPIQIMEMPEPDEVYVERIIPGSNNVERPLIERYAVTRARSFPYDLDDADIQEIDDGSLELLQAPAVPNELPTVIQLRLDMVRFKRQPQRRTILGEPEVEDL